MGENLLDYNTNFGEYKPIFKGFPKTIHKAKIQFNAILLYQKQN